MGKNMGKNLMKKENHQGAEGAQRFLSGSFIFSLCFIHREASV
jgi:hypothetical protein